MKTRYKNGNVDIYDLLTKRMTKGDSKFCAEEIEMAKRNRFEMFSETFQEHYEINSGQHPMHFYKEYYSFDSKELARMQREINLNQENDGWIGMSSGEDLCIDNIPILWAADIKKMCWFIDIGHTYPGERFKYNAGWITYKDSYQTRVQLYERLNEIKDEMGLFFRELTKGYLDALVKNPGIGLSKFGVGVNIFSGQSISYLKDPKHNQPSYTNVNNKGGQTVETIIAPAQTTQEQRDSELKWLLGLTTDKPFEEIEEEKAPAKADAGVWKTIVNFLSFRENSKTSPQLNSVIVDSLDEDKKEKGKEAEKGGSIKEFWKEFTIAAEGMVESKRLGLYLAMIGRSDDKERAAGYLKKYYLDNRSTQEKQGEPKTDFAVEEQVIKMHRLMLEMKKKYFVGNEKLYLYLVDEIRRRIEENQGIFKEYEISNNSSLRNWINDKLLNGEGSSKVDEEMKNMKSLWSQVHNGVKENFIKDFSELYSKFKGLEGQELSGIKLTELTLGGLKDLNKAEKNGNLAQQQDRPAAINPLNVKKTIWLAILSMALALIGLFKKSRESNQEETRTFLPNDEPLIPNVKDREKKTVVGRENNQQGSKSLKR